MINWGEVGKGALSALNFYNDWLSPTRGPVGGIVKTTGGWIADRLGPTAGTNPTPEVAPAPGSKVKERLAAQAERDAPYARQIRRNQDQQAWDSSGYVAPIYRDTPESIGAASIQQPDYRNAIMTPGQQAPSQPRQSALDNLNTMTPSQTGSGKTAMQVIEEFLSASTAENRKKLNELEGQVRGMANPYDTSRPEFKAALAGAANRVASVMGQRSAQDIRQMAGAGMLGSAKAAAMKYNQEESARRAQASAQEGLYSQAMQGYNAFEQKRLSDLAALRGQAFRDEMQGIGALANTSREALTLDLDIRAKNIANDLAGIQLEDTKQTTDERRALIKGELQSKLDMLPIQNEATRAALETAAAQGKLDAGQIGVLQGISDRYGPGALMILLQGMNFVKGFVNSAGSSLGTAAKVSAGGV